MDIEKSSVVFLTEVCLIVVVGTDPGLGCWRGKRFGWIITLRHYKIRSRATRSAVFIALGRMLGINSLHIACREEVVWWRNRQSFYMG